MGRPDWIEVGRIVRPHGIHGEVRVSPSTDNPERFAPGSRLFVRPRGAALDERHPLLVAGYRGDPAFPIVSFRGVCSREEAEVYHDALLEVPGSELPELEEGEFYPFELEGLEVRTPEGRKVGQVKELLEAPANDVLVVTLDSGRDHLLPFVYEAVPEVEPQRGFVVVVERFLPGNTEE